MVVSLCSAASFSLSKSQVHLIWYTRPLTSVHSTQKILHNARMAESGRIPRDPLKESISLELDMINIL